MIWLLFAAIGLFSGFVAGLLGVGGGIILVPLFLEALPTLPGVQMPVQTALGTSHAVVLLTSLAAVRAQARYGGIDWTTVGKLSAGGVAGIFLGSYAAARLPGHLFRYFFAAFLFAVAVRTLRSAQRPQPVPPARPPGLPATLAAGAGIGTFASFFGVGGGILAVPYLLRFQGKPLHDTLATSNGLIVAMAGLSLLAYVANGWGVSGGSPWLLGFVHLGAAGAAGAGAAIGASGGVRVARRTSRRSLLVFFSLLLLAVMLRLLLKG